MILKVSSNPNHSVILWFFRYALLFIFFLTNKDIFCPNGWYFDHLTSMTATGILISLCKKASLSLEVLWSIASTFLLTSFPWIRLKHSLNFAQYNFAYQMPWRGIFFVFLQKFIFCFTSPRLHDLKFEPLHTFVITCNLPCNKNHSLQSIFNLFQKWSHVKGFLQGHHIAWEGEICYWFDS